MIPLTKLDDSLVIVNVETIKYVESVPDTLIHFVNGDSLIVRESLDQLMEHVINLRAKIIHNAQKMIQDPTELDRRL